MSIQHHSAEDADARSRLLDEFLGKAVRNYPDRRLGHEDEGETAFAIAADLHHNIIRIQFTKPMNWLGLDVKSARHLSKLIAEKANELERGRSANHD